MRIGAPPDHGDALARANARREQQVALGTRGPWDELLRRHLRFERFGGVVDERDETTYHLHRGVVEQDTKAVVASYVPEDSSIRFLERAKMTHKAVVRIAQVATPDLFLSRTVAEGREMWHTGALRRAPDPAVLVDHGAQRVGRVFALEEWDFPDGTWTVVRCQLRTVPEWLRGGSCGSAASMG